MANRIGDAAGFLSIVGIAAVVSVLLWGPVLLAGLVVVGTAALLAVIRDLVRELRGRRPEHVAGPVGLRDLEPESIRMRHFHTPNTAHDRRR